MNKEVITVRLKQLDQIRNEFEHQETFDGITTDVNDEENTLLHPFICQEMYKLFGKDIKVIKCKDIEEPYYHYESVRGNWGFNKEWIDEEPFKEICVAFDKVIEEL